MRELLQGVPAFVTGGGSGIGRGVALRLAREGARVVVAGRRRGPLDETRALAGREGLEVQAVELDVTDAAAVRDVVDRVATDLGGLQCLVNNAGTGGPNACSGPGEDRWRAVLAVNLDGVFHCSRERCGMREGGAIVNVSSVLGKFGVPGYTAYCASKHGVIGFTKALALEVAPRHIRVNAVCPGWVESDMARQGMEGIAAETGQSYADARAMALAQVPLGAMIQPEEIGGLVAWLASEEARNMTGQAINYSGGSAMW
ncbi:MAG: SDR family NAD(P)-dependent oxidoreductase [Planctomycetota bacterium]